MIYLLEDNKIFIRSFKKWIAKKEIECTIHKSKEEYKFIEADYYLVDLQLEKSYSFDIIRDIRSNTKAPIAMFTHHTDNDLLKKAIDSGANYYFCKTDTQLYSIHLELLWKMKDTTL